MIEKVIK